MKCSNDCVPRRTLAALAALAAFAFAAPGPAQAKPPVVAGFHIPAGRDVHGTLRCYFGSNSVTCVPSLPYEFQKRCAHGERRFGLHPRLGGQPKHEGCSRTRLSQAGSGYTLRRGHAVLAPDERTACSYAARPSLSLICYHPGGHAGDGFLFFPSTGNIERY